jgi:glycosyltransferase involved in cell wall biosynthesis
MPRFTMRRRFVVHALAVSRLCVVLPAFNEAAHIGRIVDGVRGVHLEGVTVTPLVVDDGARDATVQQATRAGATVVSHRSNRGVGAAFRTGLEWALADGADYLVHMNSDGRLAPREIPLLYHPVARGEADLALGSRFRGPAPEHYDAWRALAHSTLARTVGLLTGYSLHDLSCGFRCMNRKLMESLHPNFDHDYLEETLIQALALRARVIEVPVTVRYDGRPAATVISRRSLRYAQRFVGIAAWSLVGFYRERARQLVGD